MGEAVVSRVEPLVAGGRAVAEVAVVGSSVEAEGEGARRKTSTSLPPAECACPLSVTTKSEALLIRSSMTAKRHGRAERRGASPSESTTNLNFSVSVRGL